MRQIKRAIDIKRENARLKNAIGKEGPREQMEREGEQEDKKTR